MFLGYVYKGQVIDKLSLQTMICDFFSDIIICSSFYCLTESILLKTEHVAFITMVMQNDGQIRMFTTILI